MRATATLLLLASTLGCREEASKMASPSSPLAAIPSAQLEALAGKRIYFGHQSVGYNLVDGLSALAKERPELRLRFVESRAASELRPGTFAHAENGQNVKPLSKIRDFTETLEQGVGANADIAFFKFCYVDFPPGGDVEKVFAEYQAAVARLHERYPNVRFVHVTSPLTTVPSGLKVTIKRLLGRGDQRDARANVLRERFNELMRKEYASREPFFDLAAVEARRPDGSLTTFELDGARHPALSPEYASDEGHLNAQGARWAAAHLLAALASAAR
jgi:hypothetical protein